ncbi:unnamed protein product, partial [Ectocarpus sp. 4 AP-2014]
MGLCFGATWKKRTPLTSTPKRRRNLLMSEFHDPSIFHVKRQNLHDTWIPSTLWKDRVVPRAYGSQVTTTGCAFHVILRLLTFGAFLVLQSGASVIKRYATLFCGELENHNTTVPP